MVKEKTASVAKVGIIYTISNILVRGMAFLTTPIFTRLLSQTEYGEFSNISAWANIISIVVTLQLYVSIVRAKYDYSEEIDKYLSSILILGNLITLICWGVVELQMPFFEKFFDMDKLFIRIIFIYALFSPAMQILTYKNRIYSKYKAVVCFTWITLITATGGSVILVLLLENRLLGRVIGNYFFVSIVDLGLWFYIIFKGRCVSPKYWKYALTFSVPLIPHELAGQLLLSSDRIIIKKICGAEDAALYSLAYTISTIASVLLTSLNQAWQPWLYDRIEENKKDVIYKYSIPYTIVFAAGCCGVMLVGPEIVYIFGGQVYSEAKYVIPPVCFGIMLQFVYTLYANIEFYKKKTGWISAATLISAIVNIGLNFLLIPSFGYVAAAYTTAIGFGVMVVFHYCVVRFKTDLADIYNLKMLLLIVLVVALVTGISLILYKVTMIRFFVILLYLCMLVCVIIKNKNEIIRLLKKG